MAELKITDLVDQSAIDGLRELSTELKGVRSDYESTARELVKGLKVKVEVVGDIEQLQTIIASSARKAEEATNRLNTAMERQNGIVAQTTNTISRELAEIEKENAKKREAVEIDQRATKVMEDQLGTLGENIHRMKEYQTQMDALKAAKKENGSLTEAQMRQEVQLKQAMSELNLVIKNQVKEQQAADGSYQQLSLRLEMLKKAYKAMNDEEKTGEKGKALAAEIQKMDAHLKDLAADMGEFQRNVGNYAVAGQSVKKELKELVTEIATLTVAYRQMSDEEKNSAQGMELAAKIQESTARAAELKDAVADVNREISVGAGDTKAFTAITEGVNMLISGFGAAKGAATLLGLSEKDLMQVQAKLQAILVVSNGLTKVQNALQKESAVMCGVRTIQEKAQAAAIAVRTAAEGKGTVAVKSATVAQSAFNVVAKANPYVLLAAALLTVVGALTAFAIGTKKAAEEEKKLQEEHERTVAVLGAVNEARKEANKSIAEEATKIKILHKIARDSNADYETRKKAIVELQRIVPGYHGSLTKEGKLINDNVKVLNLYTKNLLAAAQAQSYFSKLAEAEGDVLNARMKVEAKSYNGKAVQREIDRLQAQMQDELLKSGGGAASQGIVAKYTSMINAKKKELEAQNAALSDARKELNIAMTKSLRLQKTFDNDPKLQAAFTQITASENSGSSSGGVRSGSRSGSGGVRSGSRSGSGGAGDKSDPLKLQEELLREQLGNAEKYSDEWLSLTKQLNQNEYEQKMKSAKQTGEALKTYRNELAETLARKNEEAERQASDNTLKIAEETHQKKMKADEEAFAASQSLRDQQFQKELGAVQKKYADGLITEEQYQSASEALNLQYAKIKAEDSVAYLRKMLDSSELTEKEREELARKLTDAQIASEKASADATIAANKAKIASDQERLKKAQQALQLISDSVGAISDLTSSIYDGKISRIEDEEEALDEQYTKDVERIEQLQEQGVISQEEANQRKIASEEAKAAREKQLEEEKAKLKRKAAIADKAASMVQAAISTALAILQVYSSPGNGNFISKSVLAGVMAGIGAIQLASIAAQPLPQYAKGTRNHPGGMAIVGDGGRSEVIEYGGRSFVTPDVPTLVTMPKGAVVHPDAQDYTGLIPMTQGRDGKVGYIVNPTNVLGLEKRTDETNRLLKMQMRQQSRLAYDMKYNSYKSSRL